MKSIKILLITIRLGLGLLFVYAGIQKFVPQPPPPKSDVEVKLPEHVVKIKAFIGGMKQTGYFWPMLGATELLAGLLLLSQVYALLGAVLLVPVTTNIFLFHLFLKPNDPGETALTALYLAANLSLIGYAYPQLKSVFLNYKA